MSGLHSSGKVLVGMSELVSEEVVTPWVRVLRPEWVSKMVLWCHQRRRGQCGQQLTCCYSVDWDKLSCYKLWEAAAANYPIIGAFLNILHWIEHITIFLTLLIVSDCRSIAVKACLIFMFQMHLVCFRIPSRSYLPAAIWTLFQMIPPFTPTVLKNMTYWC